MIAFFNFFIKITGYIIQKIIFRTKIFYEDKSVQSRKIKGPAIIVSNHTSVYDYACFLFVFPTRTLRYQMAEVLFKKRLLGLFLKMLGGIRVDRASHDFGFMEKSKRVLDKGGIVGIFPEGRLPKAGETAPLPFKSGAAYLSLYANVKVIPVYTDGNYFCKQNANVVIGKPICVSELYDDTKTEKENLNGISQYFRKKVIDLRDVLNEKI